MYPPIQRATVLPGRCRRCEEEISPHADECPACGYDPGGTARDVGAVVVLLSVPLAFAVPALGIFGFFVGVVVFGWSFLASPSE